MIAAGGAASPLLSGLKVGAQGALIGGATGALQGAGRGETSGQRTAGAVLGGVGGAMLGGAGAKVASGIMRGGQQIASNIAEMLPGAGRRAEIEALRESLTAAGVRPNAIAKTIAERFGLGSAKAATPKALDAAEAAAIEARRQAALLAARQPPATLGRTTVVEAPPAAVRAFSGFQGSLKEQLTQVPQAPTPMLTNAVHNFRTWRSGSKPFDPRLFRAMVEELKTRGAWPAK